MTESHPANSPPSAYVPTSPSSSSQLLLKQQDDNSDDDKNTDHDQHAEGPFPQHDVARTWLLTAGTTLVATVLARALLSHGDKVVAGVHPSERESPHSRREEFGSVVRDCDENEDWKERFRIEEFDQNSVADCQAAVARTVETFGSIDIVLCCGSEAYVGSIEEFGQSTRTRSLVMDQFATNFFGPVNVIKAALPTLRSQRNGHIILLTGITGHLGTPGLGMYCASQWAIEGYCDSLAYEIAPFNIKLSIVQSNIEVSLLTNKVTVVPPMPAYLEPENPAPLTRNIIGRLLDKLDDTNTRSPNATGENTTTMMPPSDDVQLSQLPSAQLMSNQITELYPSLPVTFRHNLVAETVYAIAAIGGHDNPPARHIVGFEGVASVKEKLRTVSEELEDFLEVSGAVDLS